MQSLESVCNNCFPIQNTQLIKKEKERVLSVERILTWEEMRFMNDHPMTPVGIAKQIEIEKFKAQEALKQKELASRKRQPRKIKE